MALAASIFASSCGDDGNEAEESTRDSSVETGGELIVNAGAGPSSLDPQNTMSSFDTVATNFYITLFRLGTKAGPDGTEQYDYNVIEPFLAESVDISDDGLTYTIDLRPGLTFASGTPVDAAAVKATFERGLDNGASYFLQTGIPDNITKIEAPTETQVVITLAQASPEILQGWAIPSSAILDPTVIADAEAADEFLAANEAGSGPFRLVSYQPNKHLVMEARPEYVAWASENGLPVPASEQVTVNFISSAETLLLQAESGAADVTIGLSKRALASMREDGARVVGFESVRVLQMLMPWEKAPFDNARFREALTYAVPYEEILDTVAAGLGRLYYGPVPPPIAFYNDDLSQPLTFDLDRARELIGESGVATPVDIELTIVEGDSSQEEVATVLQAVWSELDINVSVNVLTPAQYSSAVFGLEVQAALRLDGPGIIDAGYYLGYDMRAQSVGFETPNPGQINIPDADTLLDEARVTLSPGERQDYYDQITELWRANSPKILFYNDEETFVFSPELTSFTYRNFYEFLDWGVSS